MNLYHITQEQKYGYDTFDGAVVCAKSEDEARLIHPRTGLLMTDMTVEAHRWGEWALSPDKVKVRPIGVADASLSEGIVEASYNAG